MKKLMVNFVRALGLVFSGISYAGSSSSTLAVSVSVANVCVATSPATLAFGSYDPTSTAFVSGTANLVISCTPGAVYHVVLDGGTGGNKDVRQMSNANKNTIIYSLFNDKIGGNPWPIGGSGIIYTASMGTLTNTVPIYGQIATGQAVPAGNYNDTVGITVTY